jgi:hypothetical protein
MCYCTVQLSVCEYKTYAKNMLRVGLEQMQLVSEEYSHYALTRSATFGCGKEPSIRNIHLWKQSQQATSLGKCMTFIHVKTSN